MILIYLGDDIKATQRNTECQEDASGEAGLEISAKRRKYKLKSGHYESGEQRSSGFRTFGTTVTDLNYIREKTKGR
jgi:hypothetical protein